MSAPPGWKFGDPLTQEMKDKMAEGRRRTAEAKRKGKPPKQKKPAAPRPERAPMREGVAGIAEKTRKKAIKLVASLLIPPDALAGAVMSRITQPIYKLDDGGLPMVDDKGRKIIEGRARAFTDEQIEADRLEKWERYWLADELTSELLAHKLTRKWLLWAVQFEEKSSLPMCVSMIVVSRMMNHGMIPPGFSDFAKEAIGQMRKRHPAPRDGEDEKTEPETVPETLTGLDQTPASSAAA